MSPLKSAPWNRDPWEMNLELKLAGGWDNHHEFGREILWIQKKADLCEESKTLECDVPVFPCLHFRRCSMGTKNAAIFGFLQLRVLRTSRLIVIVLFRAADFQCSSVHDLRLSAI